MVPAKASCDQTYRPTARSSAPTIPEALRVASPVPPSGERVSEVDDKPVLWCVDDGQDLTARSTFEVWMAVSSGELCGTTLVWREGMECWTPLQDVFELACAIPSPDDIYTGLDVEESGIVEALDVAALDEQTEEVLSTAPPSVACETVVVDESPAPPPVSGVVRRQQTFWYSSRRSLWTLTAGLGGVATALALTTGGSESPEPFRAPETTLARAGADAASILGPEEPAPIDVQAHLKEAGQRRRR